MPSNCGGEIAVDGTRVVQPALGLDLAGWVTLTGSEAGKVPSRPCSRVSGGFLLDLDDCFGSSAYLSTGAGLNFSDIRFSFSDQRRPQARGSDRLEPMRSAAVDRCANREEASLIEKRQSQIVETATEARQAELGPSVLLILIVSIILAAAVLGAVWFIFFRT